MSSNQGTPESRVLELAKLAARELHGDYISARLDDAQSVGEHHVIPFETCPHLDCAAVRASSEGSAPEGPLDDPDFTSDDAPPQYDAPAAEAWACGANYGYLRALPALSSSASLPIEGAPERRDQLVTMPRDVLLQLAGMDPQKQELLAAWDRENELRLAAEDELKELRASLGAGTPQELHDLVREASEIMQIVYAGNFPAGIESFLVRAHRATQEPPQGAGTPQALDVEALRQDLHMTYNGGHHDEPAHGAFHHGMDTVCNVLAARQKDGRGAGTPQEKKVNDGSI